MNGLWMGGLAVTVCTSLIFDPSLPLLLWNDLQLPPPSMSLVIAGNLQDHHKGPYGYGKK